MTTTPLRRLLDEGEDDFACQLLLAAEAEDVPSPEVRKRTMRALKLGGSTAALALTWKWLSTSAWKWGVSWAWKGVAVAVVASGTAMAVDKISEPAVPAPPLDPTAQTSPRVTSPTTAAPKTRIAPPMATAAEAEPAPTVDDEVEPPPSPRPQKDLTPPPTATTQPRVVPAPVPVAAPPTPIDTSPTPSASPSPPPTTETTPLPPRGLAGELAFLDEARKALAARDPRRALARLDAYDAAYPRGALSQEATILRIEALMAAGDTSRARELGHRFLEAHPNAVQGGRVRTLLHETPAP
jgi:hypothetical protein